MADLNSTIVRGKLRVAEDINANTQSAVHIYGVYFLLCSIIFTL